MILFVPSVLLASACFAASAAVNPAFVEGVLKRDILPPNAGAQSFTVVYNEVEAADAEADAKWLRLKTRADYDAYRAAMRAKFVEAVGGFPARTPLNAKVMARVPRTGYRVEKVLFESQPGVYVTALAYLPDETTFKPPYAAFLVSCGHSGLGKGEEDYGRVCVMAALQGLASLIYDPIGQGERTQVPETNNCAGHNRYGALAALLGKSTARQRLWDGMRAMDYLDTRDDIRHDGYGFMGNSGGGTMTALIEALDDRITAAAPSCYLTNLRLLNVTMGPQDAEQNVFGQLAFGLNHAGYVLMGGNAVRMHCCHNDMFSFTGSLSTYRVVKETASRLGLGDDRYGMTDVPGPHGWKESLRTSSILWMRRWLLGEREALPIDIAKCRDLDVGFSVMNVDYGLGKNHVMAPKGAVKNLPGFRSVYDYLKDDLAAARPPAAPARPPADLAVLARRRAGIRTGLTATFLPVSTETTNGFEIVCGAFSFASSLRVPVIVFKPVGGAKGVSLLVGDGRRRDRHALVAAELEKGRTVAVADLLGTGEIGHQRHSFYGAKNADEEFAVMYYWLGKSLVGERAEEIGVVADFLARRFGTKVNLVGAGTTAVAAAHAYAVNRDLYAGVDVKNAPLGWAEAVRTSAFYRFADVVNGAILDYDWKDLLP